jgi:hypothetical protein
MAGDIYLAGEHAPAGLYREIDTRREVQLEEDGILPTSLDGRSAAYFCVRHLWGQHRDRQITAP